MNSRPWDSSNQLWSVNLPYYQKVRNNIVSFNINCVKDGFWFTQEISLGINGEHFRSWWIVLKAFVWIINSWKFIKFSPSSEKNGVCFWVLLTYQARRQEFIILERIFILNLVGRYSSLKNIWFFFDSVRFLKWVL